MKFIVNNISCPKCKHTMLEVGDGTIKCVHTTCKQYGILYEEPKIDLKKVPPKGE